MVWFKLELYAKNLLPAGKKAVDPDCANSTPTAGHKRARYSGNSAQKCTVPFGALGFSQSEVAHTHRSSSAFLTFMAARLGAEIEIQTVSLEQLGWRYVISHSMQCQICLAQEANCANYFAAGLGLARAGAAAAARQRVRAALIKFTITAGYHINSNRRRCRHRRRH